MRAVVHIFIVFLLLAAQISAGQTPAAQAVGQSTRQAPTPDILYSATTPGHDSKGIYVLKFDRKTATLTILQTMTDKRNPNFLAVHPTRKYLYVPALAIKHPELGNLSVGSDADVAVFSVRKGTFGFIDTKRTKVVGTQKLEAELTLRAGKIVWDLNGLSVPEWDQKP